MYLTHYVLVIQKQNAIRNASNGVKENFVSEKLFIDNFTEITYFINFPKQ